MTGNAGSSRAARRGSRVTKARSISSRADALIGSFGRSGLRRNIRWDLMDFVDSAGYAMWNYLTTRIS